MGEDADETDRGGSVTAGPSADTGTSATAGNGAATSKGTATGKRAEGGLGRTAMMGSVAQILGRALRALVGVGTVAVLSRYLAPDDFGLFALIFLIVSFAQILADFGIRAALVVSREVNRLREDSVFWLSVGIGFAMMLGITLLAGPIAAGFGEPRLVGPLKVAAWVFVMASMGSVPMTLLEREFRFQAVAAAEVSGAVVGALVAIALALAGQGVAALVAQQMAMALVPTLLNMRAARYWPRLQFRWGEVRPLIGFGSSLTLASMVQFAAGNMDRLVVGARLSAADLGYLTVAQQVVAAPIRTVVANVRRVTFPIMASIQDDNARITAAQARSLHAVMLVLAPVCLGLAAVAGPATRVLLGPGWDMAAQVIGIAAISVMLASINELNSNIFISKGQGWFVLRWSIFALISNALLLWLLIPYGLMAIVWGRLAYVALAVPLQSRFVARLLGFPLRQLLLPAIRPLIAALAMAICVTLVHRLLLGNAAGPLVQLILLVPAGAFFYGLCLFLFDAKAVRPIFGTVLQAVRRKAALLR